MMAMLTIIKFQLIAANCPFRVGDGRTVGRTADVDGRGHDSVGGLGALMARIIPTVAIRALFCARCVAVLKGARNWQAPV